MSKEDIYNYVTTKTVNINVLKSLCEEEPEEEEEEEDSQPK